jgi:hypothetical protein
MLHDLRCTESNPATYEKILSEQKNNNNENTPQKKSLRFSNGLRKSNVDGTSSDIKKNIKSDGREEYIETKYDTEGNIISRKKADYIDDSYNEDNFEKNNYEEVNEFDEEEDNYNSNNVNIINDINNNYNVGQINYYVEPTVNINNQQIIYTTTGPAKEIIYEAPARYDPNIIINKPIEETVINSDGNLNDNIMNDIIRKTVTKDDNIKISNENIEKYNDINNYNNYEQRNNINYINNIDTYNNINNDVKNGNIYFNIDDNNM